MRSVWAMPRLLPIIAAIVITTGVRSYAFADGIAFIESPGTLTVTPPRHALDVQTGIANLDLVPTLQAGDVFQVDLGGDLIDCFVQHSDGNGLSMHDIVGSIQGAHTGRFVISMAGDAIAGWFLVSDLGATYRVRYGGPGIHFSYRIDPAQQNECAGTVTSKFVQNNPVQPPIDTVVFDGESHGGGTTDPLNGTCSPPAWDYFDVAIVYTDDARAAAGGTNAIWAECAASVAVQWEGYFNSLLTGIRPRLVHRSEVSYAESGSTSTDLNRLLNGTSSLGYVHTQRDASAADFAVLFTNDGGSFCGRAPCTVDASEAFSVVVWDCAVDNYSMPHEIGHNIGCGHDRDTGDNCGYENGWGKWFWIPAEGMYRHTVMSYSHSGSTRIPYYSHPQVQYMGVATGSSTEDNVSVIFSRVNTCENFRLTKMDVWIDFNWRGAQNGTYVLPYDTVVEGVTRVLSGGQNLPDLPILHIKAGNRNEAITISKAMIIEACGGTVTIGQ